MLKDKESRFLYKQVWLSEKRTSFPDIQTRTWEWNQLCCVCILPMSRAPGLPRASSDLKSASWTTAPQREGSSARRSMQEPSRSSPWGGMRMTPGLGSVFLATGRGEAHATEWRRSWVLGKLERLFWTSLVLCVLISGCVLFFLAAGTSHSFPAANYLPFGLKWSQFVSRRERHQWVKWSFTTIRHQRLVGSPPSGSPPRSKTNPWKTEPSEKQWHEQHLRTKDTSTVLKVPESRAVNFRNREKNIFHLSNWSNISLARLIAWNLRCSLLEHFWPWGVSPPNPASDNQS